MAGVIINIDTPYLSVAEYAKRTGLTVEGVKRRIRNGLIPFIHQKKPGAEKGIYMVNNAVLIKTAMQQEESEVIADGSEWG